MKKIDYKTKDKTEISKEIASAQEKLRLFRFGASGAKSKNVKEGMIIRRNIARMMTELNSKKV